MLEKERFLAIKKLAHDIREDNKKVFKSFDKMSYDDAVKAKDKFIKATIENMDIAFSDGEIGREEKQIFRANILIPDDNDFFERYSKDKNIRNLMNYYEVNIEDIMSKITELNVYEKYLSDEDDDFADEMTKITPKEAESLLDEIDNLSSVMEDLDLGKTEEKTQEEVQKIEETSEVEETQLVEEESDDFDDITSAVSNFVDKFDSMQAQMGERESQLNEKDTQINALKEDLEKAIKENESLSLLKEDNVALKEEVADLKNKNSELQSLNTTLNAKLAKYTEVLNKIYKSISKNNH